MHPDELEPADHWLRRGLDWLRAEHRAIAEREKGGVTEQKSVYAVREYP